MLVLRKVEVKDIKTLFDWANDPVTRRNSLRAEEISWSEHEKWFHSYALEDNKNLYLIGLEDNNPVGFIRFEYREEWIVSIVISPIHRGKGVGSRLLKEGIRYFERIYTAPLLAHIKSSNYGSIKVFEKNLFVLFSAGEVQIYKRERK